MMMSSRRWFILCALLPPLHAVADEPAEPVAQTENVMQRQGFSFLDSRLFDSKLSQELNSGKNRVEVEVSGRVSLAAIPPRLDKWISRVGEHGSVEVRESPAKTRAIFSLLPLLFEAIMHMSEERMLEPAKDYNATIFYKRDGGGDTVLDRIVFTRKRAQ